MSKIVQTPTNIKNRTRKAMQRGFSNVQIAIGILVTVILLLGALSGYQYIQQAKVNNEVAALTELKAATSNLGQANGAFASTGDATSTLIGLNFFQSSAFTVSGTSVKNQWNGDVTAAWKDNNIAYTFKAVTSSVCKEIIPKVKNIVATVTIGTKTLDFTAATILGDVVTACTPTSPATTVDIVYSISR